MIRGPTPKWTGKEYNEAILILGGRSGKSALTGAITSYEACCTDWTSYIRPGEFAWHLVFATREQQAVDLGKNVIFANIKQSPFLRDLIIDDPKELENIQLPRSRAGVMVLKTGAAITAFPCSSNVGRGYPIAVCVLDEAAFYARMSSDTKGKNSDQEIYDAILPRQIQFGDRGKMFIITTPADKTGLVWAKWRDRAKHPGLYYIQKTPTWKIRTDFKAKYFEEYRKRSPFGFNREFGAQFTDSMAPLLMEKDVMACVRKDDNVLSYNKDNMYEMGIDAAFGERDRFSVAVGHIEDVTDDREYKVVIDVAEVIEATTESDVHDTAVDRVVELYNQYDCYDVIADQYQGDAFAKTLDGRGVNVEIISWTVQNKRSRYGKLRALIKRKMISLPHDSDLIDELLGLQVKFLASGQYTVQHRAGGNDDVSDSVAQVVEKLYEEDPTSIGVEVM